MLKLPLAYFQLPVYSLKSAEVGSFHCVSSALPHVLSSQTSQCEGSEENMYIFLCLLSKQLGLKEAPASVLSPFLFHLLRVLISHVDILMVEG